MTVSTVEILAGFKAAGSTFYSQVASADPSLNTDVISVIASGDTHPRFVAANGGREEIPFETSQIATLLGQCGLFGCDAGPVDLLYRKVSTVSGRVAAATSEHSRIRATEALMYIQSLTAGNRQLATARGRVVPVYDGTNAILINTGSLALSETPTTAENFVLGPISVDDAKIPGCDNFELNLNPQAWELSDESDDATTFAAINTIAPVLSFITNSPTALALNKVAIASDNLFRCHLIRKKRNESRYLDNETQHIRIEAANGILLVQAITGSSPKQYRVELRATGIDSGNFSDSPLSISVNSAIALPA